jgi:hypothetical protein
MTDDIIVDDDYKQMLCLKSRTYVSALTLSALHYPYSTPDYYLLIGAVLSFLQCKDWNYFVLWQPGSGTVPLVARGEVVYGVYRPFPPEGASERIGAVTN